IAQWLAVALLLGNPGASKNSVAAASAEGAATLIELNGPIGPAMSRYIERSHLHSLCEPPCRDGAGYQSGCRHAHFDRRRATGCRATECRTRAAARALVYHTAWQLSRREQTARARALARDCQRAQGRQ